MFFHDSLVLPHNGNPFTRNGILNHIRNIAHGIHIRNVGNLSLIIPNPLNNISPNNSFSPDDSFRYIHWIITCLHSNVEGVAITLVTNDVHCVTVVEGEGGFYLQVGD